MKIIATSDWHLSTTKPICRIDADWVSTQINHIDALAEALIYDADLMIVAGDVFDTPTVAPILTNKVLRLAYTDKPCYFLSGNHDLPFHSVHRIAESSFGAVRTVMAANECLFDFGTEQINSNKNTYIALHAFSVPTDKDVPPNRTAYTSKKLCSMFPNTEVIIVGDNHIPWTKRIGNQLVVNCGTLIQRTATEAKHTCGYYLIDTDELTAEYKDLTELSAGCIDLSYLEDIKERETNKKLYESLINEIQDGSDDRYDFVNALHSYIKTKRGVIGEGAYNILEETIEYIKE